MHSINVTFDDTDFVHGSPPSLQPPGSLQVHLPAVPAAAVAAAEEANTEQHNKPQHNNPLFDAASSLPQQLQLPYVNIEPIQWPPKPTTQADEYHDPEHTQFTLNGDGTPQSRPRPTYEGQCNMVNSVTEDDGQYTALDLINACQVSTLTHICLHLAEHSQKDMSWKKALKGPLRDRAITALHKELDSLLNTILEEITPDHPDRAKAEAEAIHCPLGLQT